MKEKYKAIIEKIESSNKGEKVLESLVRYSCANGVLEAQKNIIYHLQNDDRIYIGIVKNESTTDKVVRWEMTRIDLERNYEQLELKVGGRGQDKKPRHRRTKAEIERERDYTILEVEVKKDLIPTLESYLKVANLNEKEYFNQLIEKDLKGKENDLKALEGLLKKIRGDE